MVFMAALSRFADWEIFALAVAIWRFVDESRPAIRL